MKTPKIVLIKSKTVMKPTLIVVALVLGVLTGNYVVLMGIVFPFNVSMATVKLKTVLITFIMGKKPILTVVVPVTAVALLINVNSFKNVFTTLNAVETISVILEDVNNPLPLLP